MAHGSSPAEAEQLFERGLERMKAGALAEGCEFIAQSHALDPLPGALFTLAECRARAGQALQAWQAFERYLAEVRALPSPEQKAQEARVVAAQRRLDELAPTLARIEVTTPGNARGTFFLDGEERAAPEPGAAWVVQPGTHRVRWVREDGGTEDVEVRLARGESRVIEWGASRTSAPPLPAPPKTEPVVKPPREPTLRPTSTRGGVTVSEHDRATTGTNAWTYTAFGIGAAGLLTGSVAGAVLISRKSTVDRYCTGRVCTQEGYEAARGVGTLDTLANVGFAVGGAGIALGLVLLFTSESPREPAPEMGSLELDLDVSRLGVRGTW